MAQCSGKQINDGPERKKSEMSFSKAALPVNVKLSGAGGMRKGTDRSENHWMVLNRSHRFVPGTW
jgi:hypothetical protein